MSAYFLAKIFSDILPLRLIPMVPFCLLTYFMIGNDCLFIAALSFNIIMQKLMFVGFQTEAANFFFYFFTLFLLTVGASSTVFFISAGVGVTAVATLLIPLSFVTQMVLKLNYFTELFIISCLVVWRVFDYSGFNSCMDKMVAVWINVSIYC